MMRSLYSGVSGLKNHQTRMDVIGNNIANVNTVGFKGSRVVFQDLYSQSIGAASANNGAMGGVNPKQVGLGMSLAAIDTMFTRSANQYTGSPYDMLVSGDGFFIVEMDGQEYYTRAGNLSLDEKGYLVTSSGYYLVGYQNQNADWTAEFQLEDKKEDRKLDRIQLPLNLFENVKIGDDGVITAESKEDDPVPPPKYTKGSTVTIGQIALAQFDNEKALEKLGGNLYRTSKNSGEASASAPGESGAGLLTVGSLEMSNVDLANEFTDMIITQRGFQANSRIITVSDTMLEELVNLKR